MLAAVSVLMMLLLLPLLMRLVTASGGYIMSLLPPLTLTPLLLLICWQQYFQRGLDTLHPGQKASDLPKPVPRGEEGAVRSHLRSFRLRKIISPAVRHSCFVCHGEVGTFAARTYLLHSFASGVSACVDKPEAKVWGTPAARFVLLVLTNTRGENPRCFFAVRGVLRAAGAVLAGFPPGNKAGCGTPKT